MLRFIFSALLCSLLLFACGKHELLPEEDIEEEFPDSSARDWDYSSSGEVVPLSSSLLLSSSSSLPSSSSDEVSGNTSSSSENNVSSSSSVNTCDFGKDPVISGECIYEETVTISDGKTITIGQNAKLYFADNASLKIPSISVSTLNIAGGAELYFGENSELNISRFSTLSIAGTSDKPVILAALDETKGWKGIVAAGTTTIDYADISGAAIGIDYNRNAILKNSQIHDNEYGIKQIDFPFANNAISGNNFQLNDYDAEVSLDVALSLGAVEQFTGKLRIPDDETIEENTILPAFTYSIEGEIIVDGGLEIEPGAHFYFSENSFIKVIGGYIKAIGTEVKPIIFEAANENGFWGASLDGVAFSFEDNCSDKSEFKYFKVLRAKTAFYNGSNKLLELSNGEVTYRDVFNDGLTLAITTVNNVSSQNVP
jgi:hypothetical protein